MVSGSQGIVPRLTVVGGAGSRCPVTASTDILPVVLEVKQMGLRMAVKRLRDNARLPVYSTSGAAGLDLRACLELPMELQQGAINLVPSGIAVAIPDGYVGLVRDRSGMAVKGVHTLAGVIDSDYRGEILVAVHNVSGGVVKIEPGDRIAQMLVLPCPQVEVIDSADLPPSERGAGGFGSTGR